MPKRVIDFDAMWGSDKLASCASWAQAEYAWLYGLADASGCFELTNLRVIWGRVAAIRRDLTIERLEQIFDEFQVKGLLFVWEHEGKRYGHWSGSDVPGRLPAPSWRMRLERLAPPVPKRQFTEYMSRFARGRAALAGGGFRGEAEQDQFESSNLRFEIPDAKQSSARETGSASFHANSGLRPLKDRVEEAQAQDLNSDEKSGGEEDLCRPGSRSACGEAADQEAQNPQNLSLDFNSKAKFDPVACGRAPEQRTYRSQKLLLDSDSKAHFNPVDRGEVAGRRTQNHHNLPLDSNSRGESVRGDQDACAAQSETNRAARTAAAGAAPAASYAWRDKSDLLARELAVGRGPVCGPVKVKPEALERMRAREAARRAGSRSP